jgi:hypothetical protein
LLLLLVVYTNALYAVHTAQEQQTGLFTELGSFFALVCRSTTKEPYNISLTKVFCLVFDHQCKKLVLCF